MPLLSRSTYRPPPFLSNGHAQTVYAALLRRVPPVAYERERIPTPDGDFLDLDWQRRGVRRLAVISHGLEGNSRRGYVRGMVAALGRADWDALAWNCRGCSGELNRQLRFYHSGATDDLATVLTHAAKGYAEVALIGFSLGGNLTLKFLGEQNRALDPRVRRAVAFSVPCDLASSAQRLAGFAQRAYMRHFLRSLREKIRAKARRFPGQLDDRDFGCVRTFRDFDGRYTAPLHGFASAEDYWAKSSCRGFLAGVPIPTLLVNARNDPFLAPECFPVAAAQHHPHLLLEMPESGGHVGFVTLNATGEYWSESRAVEFLAGR